MLQILVIAGMNEIGVIQLRNDLADSFGDQRP
jgi:hypothetical protein